MRRFAATVLVSLVAASTASAAHVTVKAVASRTAVSPGERVTVAFVFDIDPGWHLYWINPGDTGQPPNVRWTAPAGLNAGELHFPIPKRLDADGVTAFGYNDQLTLLCDLEIPQDAAGSVSLNADLQWVVCAEQCLSENQSVAIELPVGIGQANDPDSFATWRAQQPAREREAEVAVSSDGRGVIRTTLPPLASLVDAFPPASDSIVFEKAAVNADAKALPITGDGGQPVDLKFRLLPGGSTDQSGVGLVVWKDNRTGKIAGAERKLRFVPAAKEPPASQPASPSQE